MKTSESTERRQSKLCCVMEEILITIRSYKRKQKLIFKTHKIFNKDEEASEKILHVAANNLRKEKGCL